MALKARQEEEKLPPAPAQRDSVAASEVSLYRSVQKIRQEHGLENLGISFYDAETTVQRPGFTFERDGEQVEVIVFPERSAHHAPLSPIDQKPMRRAARGAVLALLQP